MGYTDEKINYTKLTASITACLTPTPGSSFPVMLVTEGKEEENAKRKAYRR